MRVNSAPIRFMTVCWVKLRLISSANEGLRSCITGLQDLFRIHRIQSARVALEPGQLRALHRTAAITCGITFRRKLKNLVKLNLDISLTWLKSRLTRRLLKPIPRANVLADIATIQPTRQIHLRGQFRRAQLDRRVRNALV